MTIINTLIWTGQPKNPEWQRTGLHVRVEFLIYHFITCLYIKQINQATFFSLKSTLVYIITHYFIQSWTKSKLLNILASSYMFLCFFLKEAWGNIHRRSRRREKIIQNQLQNYFASLFPYETNPKLPHMNLTLTNLQIRCSTFLPNHMLLKHKTKMEY